MDLSNYDELINEDRMGFSAQAIGVSLQSQPSNPIKSSKSWSQGADEIILEYSIVTDALEGVTKVQPDDDTNDGTNFFKKNGHWTGIFQKSLNSTDDDTNWSAII